MGKKNPAGTKALDMVRRANRNASRPLKGKGLVKIKKIGRSRLE